MARPLIPVVLALMVGIGAPAWGLNLPGKWLFWGLLALWTALALAWGLRRPVRFLPLAFFGLLGVAFYQQACQPFFPPHHLARLPQDENLTFLGHLNRPSKIGPERVQLFLKVEAMHSPQGWRPATGQLLVLAPPLEPPPLGTEVVLRGRLREPSSLNNPGAFNRPRQLAAEGIFRQVRLRELSDLVFLASTEKYPLGEKLRGGIRKLLKDLTPTERAIYLAMLLGDQGEITPPLRQAFARTGTSHLLVINGLHLSMVAAATYFLSFWVMRRFPWLLLRVNAMKVATLLAVGPVMAYAWIAGGSPSTQRAEVMVLAYLLLVFLGRPRELWSALALAALVILCLAPLRLFSISFQLSFAAVAAIVHLVPRWVRMSTEASSTSDRAPAGLGARLYFRGKEALAVSAAATLATAPLVAAYFQVVSILGILVNLVAIPLVLGLALPLGEVAVLAQAFSLTPVAQVFLALGRLPLWLGFEAISLAARLPGSAIIMPIPTWLQIACYYVILILLFAPRRNYLTWAGSLLAGGVLLLTLALPWWRTPQTLEVTCLDSYGTLSGVVVTPENRRLAFSAPAPSWRGARTAGFGPLPSYCHWRQFRRLDQVAALNLSQENSPELLTLAQQFNVAEFWFGRRGVQGPAYWELWNYLGDRGRGPRSLEKGRPPASLGSVGLKFLPLGTDQGLALQLAYEGRRVLLLPPLKELSATRLGAAVETPLEVLILPGDLAQGGDLGPVLTKLKPRRLVIYGGGDRSQLSEEQPLALPSHFTREGAVSLFFSPTQVTVRQWRP